jgi:hypothetical protein
MDYLYDECQNTGVAFRFGQEIKRIEKSMRGQLQAVDIGSSKPGNVNEINIACHNIIVAAGSQTPEALDDIITWLDPKHTFENHTERYEWARAPLGEFFDGEELGDVSLIIRSGNNLTGKGKGKANDSSSSSFSILTAKPETNTILAASIGKPITSKPVPGVQTFSEAEKTARTHLKNGKTAIPTAASSKTKTKTNNNNEDNSDSDSDSSSSNKPPKSPVLQLSGSATISTSFSHAPLVDMIPWPIVDPRVLETVRDDGTTKTTMHRLGIYVAYGCGRHGTTLAPGVAKIVVSNVFGGGGGKDVKDEDAAVLAGVGEAYAWPEVFDE